MAKQLLRALTVVVTVAAVALVGLGGPASAAPPERGTFQDDFGPFEEQDFCGSPGLTVLIEGTETARFQEGARGKEQLPYYMEHVSAEVVYTNASTGDYVREVQRLLAKDLKVTDNGDGTSTILVLATGNATIYDSNGKAIARNPGQTRFEILIDNAGTPSDSSDDQFLAFLGVVKESTGRTDDFCTAVVGAIG